MKCPDARSRLSIILWLVAVHSFCVGLCLISLPSHVMLFFGFTLYGEKFFPVQGGMLHIVMTVAYGLAAWRAERFDGLILLAIIAKFLATVFLISYYLWMERIWLVLFSGIVDGLMGLAILWAYGSYKNSLKGYQG